MRHNGDMIRFFLILCNFLRECVHELWILASCQMPAKQV